MAAVAVAATEAVAASAPVAALDTASAWEVVVADFACVVVLGTVADATFAFVPSAVADDAAGGTVAEVVEDGVVVS